MFGACPLCAKSEHHRSDWNVPGQDDADAVGLTSERDGWSTLGFCEVVHTRLEKMGARWGAKRRLACGLLLLWVWSYAV